MRTYVNSVVANRNVIGFGQDRVVSFRNDSCAPAAQHLESRHAAKRARGLTRALKRMGSAAAVAAPALKAKWTCLAITGPARLTVRQMSPVVVVT
ncbi:MAG: hypothetical protein WD063_03685 [Pirellulales bacterium]